MLNICYTITQKKKKQGGGLKKGDLYIIANVVLNFNSQGN